MDSWWYKLSNQRKFSPQNLIIHQFAKVFSLERFPLYDIALICGCGKDNCPISFSSTGSLYSLRRRRLNWRRSLSLCSPKQFPGLRGFTRHLLRSHRPNHNYRGRERSDDSAFSNRNKVCNVTCSTVSFVQFSFSCAEKEGLVNQSDLLDRRYPRNLLRCPMV